MKSISFLLFFSLTFLTKTAAQPPDTARAWVLIMQADSILNQNQFKPGLVLLDSANQIYRAANIKNDRSALCLEGIGSVQFYLGDRLKGIEAFEAALEIYKIIEPPESLRVAVCLNNLAMLYGGLGELKKSNEMYGQALAIHLKINDFCGTDIANVYNNLGSNYLSLGEPKTALPLLEKALELRRKCKGEDSPQSLINLAACFGAMGQWPQEIAFLERAIAILETRDQKAWLVLATAYGNLGSALDELAEFEKALIFYEKCLDLRQRLFGEMHGQTAIAYNNIGHHFQRLNDHRQAVLFFEKAIFIAEKVRGEVHLATFYNNLGTELNSLGDHSKAVEYHQKSLAMRLRFGGEKSMAVATSYHNLAYCFSDMDEPQKALNFMDLAFQNLQNSQSDSLATAAHYYNTLGSIHSKTAHFDEAKAAFEKSLDLRRQLFGENHLAVANSFANLADLRFWKNDLEKANEFATKSLEIRRQVFGERNAETAFSWSALAQNWQQTAHFEEAETCRKQALAALNYVENADFETVFSLPQVLVELNQLGELHQKWFEKTGDLAHLAAARNWQKQAIAAFEKQSASLSPASKSTLADWAKTVFVNAATTQFSSVPKLRFGLEAELRDTFLKKAFEFSERAKAAQLLDALHESGARQFAGIPDSLLQKEYDLRVAVAFFDKKQQAILSAGAAPADSNLQLVNGRLFHLNRQLDGLKTHFDTAFHDYFLLKNNRATASVDWLQTAGLAAGQSLVEYFIGDSVGFVFLIKKDGFIARPIEVDSLSELVRACTKAGIYGCYALPKTQQTDSLKAATEANYTHSAQRLYQKLLAPIAADLTERLLIIPDGVLAYLPFEALLTGPPPRFGAFDSYPFLLHERQVSYCPSATLWREFCEKRPTKPADLPLLAMAPFFRDDVEKLLATIDSTTISTALRDALKPLPASGKEVATLAKNWGGTAFYGQQATVRQFTEQAARHRILHLSTHAEADDRLGDYAFLAFAAADSATDFEKLYARDIWQFSLNAEMVVLSACETGLGKLRRGEGLVSLSRAFAAAGAKSIFTTLWKVDDGKMRDLTLLFYGHLKAEKPKDEALCRAKRELLKKQKGRGCHPFFWAGLIGIGDMRRLD